jgi:hypothetical protein
LELTDVLASLADFGFGHADGRRQAKHIDGIRLIAASNAFVVRTTWINPADHLATKREAVALIASAWRN